MVQIYLINILIFCAILLLIAFVVGMIQLILILVDVRRVSREISKKVVAFTGIFDVLTLLIKGFAAGKSLPFIAGLKKALQVLVKK